MAITQVVQSFLKAAKQEVSGQDLLTLEILTWVWFLFSSREMQASHIEKDREPCEILCNTWCQAGWGWQSCQATLDRFVIASFVGPYVIYWQISSNSSIDEYKTAAGTIVPLLPIPPLPREHKLRLAGVLTHCMVTIQRIIIAFWNKIIYEKIKN